MGVVRGGDGTTTETDGVRVARAVLVVVSTAFLGWVALAAWPSVSRGVQAAVTPAPTDAREWDANRLQVAQFDCIGEQIANRVPPGATVYVSDQTGSPWPDLWEQRLAELAFRRATIVSSPEQADYRLKVMLVPAGEPRPGTTAPPGPSSCFGVRLEMTAT